MKPVSVNVRVIDLPKVAQLLGAVADLMRALDDVDGLPAPVMEACDRIRRQAAELGGQDAGPPP